MAYQLAQPEVLWGFLPLGVFCLYLLYRRSVWPEGFSWRRFWLTLLAFAFGILAMSRPQGGALSSTPEPLSSHLFLAVDVSNSMLAEDILPNRLRFSTLFIQKLLESLSKPKVALYPFAATGFLQLPLTSDVYALNESLGALEPSITSSQGTDLNEALAGLLKTLQRAESVSVERHDDWHTPRIVLFSDGESHAKMDSGILKEFEKKGIPIFTVGVGTEEGALIPKEVLPSGMPVKTKLETEALRLIATKTGGAYFSGTFENLSALANQLNSSLRFGKRKTQFKVQTELFSFFLFLSVFFLVSEFFFGRWQYVIRTLLFIVFATHSVNSLAEDDQEKGIAVYNQALKESGQGNLQKAAELFEESALLIHDVSNKKKALFNLGNAFLKMGDPEQALESYQKAYRLISPSEPFQQLANQRISENMALAAQALEMQKQQQQEGDAQSGEGNKAPGEDPKGPKQFEGDTLNENQKQKLFDLIASEEKQTQKRLREKTTPPPSSKGKPW